MLVKGVENKQWAVETALACIHDKTKAVYDLLSEEDFYKLLERVEAKYIGYENDKIFTIVQDNIPIGWCYFFVDKKNRYEKLSGLYTIDNSQYDPQEIIQYIDVNYGEYTKDVVFTRENQHMITCFEKNGYQVIEDSWHM